jgi:hypothetical protein
MMKSIYLSIFLSLAAAGSAHAQESSRQAAPADSVLVRTNIFRRLFSGITLTPQQKARAQDVIAAEDRAQWHVPPYSTCAGRQVRVDLTAHRDSTLLSMMQNAVDSAKFRTNASAFIMGPCPFPAN